MARYSLGLRMKMLLARHPVLANRLLAVLGENRVEQAGRRAAIQAAQRAFAHVPFYRDLFTQKGFDAKRMRHLNWKEFQQLPTVGKAEAMGFADEQLLDDETPMPAGDSLLGRSSGTTHEPVTWPTGWDEFYSTRSFIEATLEAVGAHRSRTAVVLGMPVEGAPLSGNISFRIFFSIKEKTRWPFEIVAAGEEPSRFASILHWLAERHFEVLYLATFPGTIERLLEYLARERQERPQAALDWTRFPVRRVLLGGQLVSRAIRDRVRADMQLGDDLDAIEVALSSSDTGQAVAHSTRFTTWLERYMDDHPELAEALGIPLEHRTKPIMEFAPSLAIYLEQDPKHGLLLTTWKHRPLIRYRSNDLAWVQSAKTIRKALNEHARGWRQAFYKAGGKRSDIPSVATLGMILGRADEVCIVNGANITPDILRDALVAAGIMPELHHFKHAADADRPNVYLVYLELPEERGPEERAALAERWRQPLLDALVAHPAATDLKIAHTANPIDLHLFVRSRGQDEFLGDDKRSKTSYGPVPVPVSTSVAVPMSVSRQPGEE